MIMDVSTKLQEFVTPLVPPSIGAEPVDAATNMEPLPQPTAPASTQLY
jgi:hypothetical protein